MRVSPVPRGLRVGIDVDYPLCRYFVAAALGEFAVGRATAQLRRIGAALASDGWTRLAQQGVAGQRTGTSGSEAPPPGTSRLRAPGCA